MIKVIGRQAVSCYVECKYWERNAVNPWEMMEAMYVIYFVMSTIIQIVLGSKLSIEDT